MEKSHGKSLEIPYNICDIPSSVCSAKFHAQTAAQLSASGMLLRDATQISENCLGKSDTGHPLTRYQYLWKQKSCRLCQISTFSGAHELATVCINSIHIPYPTCYTISQSC